MDKKRLQELIDWCEEHEEEQKAFRDGCNEETDGWVYHHKQMLNYFSARTALVRANKDLKK